VFARVVMRVSDVEASRRFYATLLGALAAPDDRAPTGEADRFAWGEFALVQASEAAAMTRGLHIRLRGVVACGGRCVLAGGRAGRVSR
jgi:catechol 2,3-dioxygenase-like lactoylglutathione lyase family enzyme